MDERKRHISYLILFTRSGLDSRRYQIFWVVGLERGPLNVVSTTEELLEKSSLENRYYGRMDPSRRPRGTL
jgi:hypothetical protein